MKQFFLNKEAKATIQDTNNTTYSSTKETLYWAINKMIIKKTKHKVLSNMKISRQGYKLIDVMPPLWRFIKNFNLLKHRQNTFEEYCLFGTQPSLIRTDFKILISKKIMEGEKNDQL